MRNARIMLRLIGEQLRGCLSVVLALALVVGAAAQVQAARIKDLADIAGVRSNQLLGYGLVVGLDGSGDKDNAAPYTMQSLRSMLTQLGIVVPPGVKLKPKKCGCGQYSCGASAVRKERSADRCDHLLHR